MTTNPARAPLPGWLYAASAVMIVGGLGGSCFIILVWLTFGIGQDERLEATLITVIPTVLAIALVMIAVALCRRGLRRLALAVLTPPLVLTLAGLIWAVIA